MTSQNHGGRDLPEMRSQVERVGVAGARMVATFFVTSGGVMLEASPPLPAAVAGAIAPGNHRPQPTGMFAVGSPAEAEAAATSHPCICVPVSLVPPPPLALSPTVAVAAGPVRPAVGSAQVTARYESRVPILHHRLF